MYATRMDATTMDALILVRTPTMSQHDLWVEKLWKLNSQLRLATELGCLNCANRFQTDLSTGPFRDASYVYGPSQPRRFSLRLRLLG
jgi:outer membrane receptor for ferrienterochelin and colicins